jgi:hypothetical protein
MASIRWPHKCLAVTNTNRRRAGCALLLLSIGAGSCHTSTNAWPRIKIPIPKGYSPESKPEADTGSPPNQNTGPLVNPQDNPFNQRLTPPLSPQQLPAPYYPEQRSNPYHSEQTPAPYYPQQPTGRYHPEQPPAPYYPQQPPTPYEPEQSPGKQMGGCREGETALSCILRGILNQ